MSAFSVIVYLPSAAGSTLPAPVPFTEAADARRWCLYDLRHRTKNVLAGLSWDRTATGGTGGNFRPVKFSA